MIREIYDNLTSSERDQLMIAFEEGFAQYIELPLGKFLGVHIQPTKNLRILEVAGFWAYGELVIKEKDNAKLHSKDG